MKICNLLLCGDVEESTVNPLIEKITKHNELYENHSIIIRLHIDSCGGYVSFSRKLIRCIRHSKIPIHTFAFGLCASAAFNIFLAGERRFCYDHSEFRQHPISMCRAVTRFEARGIESLTKKRDRFIMSRTKITREMLNEKINNNKTEWDIDAETAIQLEIAHRLVKFEI